MAASLAAAVVFGEQAGGSLPFTGANLAAILAAGSGIGGSD
ncbi:MAG TPA: hypothetical protein VE777_03410 [Gaiellales bacterium]|jgi:hypothetical protein|nr:hypothetical protein [Gaiellales bacterium]